MKTIKLLWLMSSLIAFNCLADNVCPPIASVIDRVDPAHLQWKIPQGWSKSPQSNGNPLSQDLVRYSDIGFNSFFYKKTMSMFCEYNGGKNSPGAYNILFLNQEAINPNISSWGSEEGISFCPKKGVCKSSCDQAISSCTW